LTAAVSVLYWATIHLVLVAVLLGWTRDWLSVGMLAASGVAAFILGLALLSYKRSDRARAVPELSLAPLLLAFGTAFALTGWAFGLWLILVGAGAAAVALARLTLELAVERRSP
jgi:hypothetical protein